MACKKARVTIAAVLACVMFPAALAAQEPFRLIVTELQAPLVPNSVMHLAQSQGFFERAGVEVQLVHVQQTPSAVAALRAGEGDMANISTEAILRLASAGHMDLKAVLSPNKALPFLIAARADFGSVEELAGAAFGIGRPGSLDHTLSLEVLAKYGLDQASLEFVGLGQPAVRAQALLSNNIDATTMSVGTWLAMPSHDGLHVLVPQDRYFEAAPIVGKLNVVPDGVLEEKGEQVEAVVEALVTASRLYADEPARWVEDMMRLRPDVDRSILRQLAMAFTRSWSVNGGLSRQELEHTAEFVFSKSDLAEPDPPDLKKWVAFGPVDAVLTRKGKVSGADEADR